MNRPIRTLACVAGIACLAAALAAQAPQQTFRAAVDVVVVDVGVVDRTGAAVQDLTANDFQVTVDGKRRNILSLQLVASRSARPPDNAPAAVEPAAQPAAQAAVAAGRAVVVAVDEQGIDPPTGRAATLAARAFVERLDPADFVAFARLPALPDRLHFTTDRSTLRKELDTIVGRFQGSLNLVRMSLYEAMEIDRQNDRLFTLVVRRECPNARGAALIECGARVRDEAISTVFQADFRAERTLAALLRLVAVLGRIEGPKAILLVSAGNLIRDTNASLIALESAFAEANVRLYALRPVPWDDGLDVTRNSTPDLQGLPVVKVEDSGILMNGLDRIAEAAGGTAINVPGSMEGAMKRVAAEMSASYLLGIEVQPGDRNGKTHEIRVAVARRGVQIRARRRFVVSRVTAAAATTPPEAIDVDPVPDERNSSSDAAPAAELLALLSRAGEYVADYATRFSVLFAEERTEIVTAARRSASEPWRADGKRSLLADYALVKAPGSPGWVPFRGVLAVNGKRVDRSGERVKDLVSEATDAAFERAVKVTADAARHDIGFARRNPNLAAIGLLFLDAANRDRFRFSAPDAPAPGKGAVVQVGFEERRRPTFVRWNDRDAPASGNFRIEPSRGTVRGFVLRLRHDDVDIEIAVTFADDDAVAFAVPVEIVETYTGPRARLQCTARYSAFERLH